MMCVRWLDVGLLFVSFPFVILAGLPLIGYSAALVAWTLQRVIAQAISPWINRRENIREVFGLTLASSLTRVWLVAIAVITVGAGVSRADGAMASAVILAAFTVYFALSLLLRPGKMSQAL